MELFEIVFWNFELDLRFFRKVVCVKLIFGMVKKNVCFLLFIGKS